VAAHTLEIIVADDGGTDRPGDAPLGGGHGLIGMRERVLLYGGRFDARAVDGGFQVDASIPLEGSA
jgi:signal transduction histidine kinase